MSEDVYCKRHQNTLQSSLSQVLRFEISSRLTKSTGIGEGRFYDESRAMDTDVCAEDSQACKGRGGESDENETSLLPGYHPKYDKQKDSLPHEAHAYGISAESQGR